MKIKVNRKDNVKEMRKKVGAKLQKISKAKISKRLKKKVDNQITQVGNTKQSTQVGDNVCVYAGEEAKGQGVELKIDNDIKFVSQVQIKHRSGEVSCRMFFGGSNFGCGSKGYAILLKKNNDVIGPALDDPRMKVYSTVEGHKDQIKFYTIDGKTDEKNFELNFKKENNVHFLKTEKLSVIYSEVQWKATGNSVSDNSGKTCFDVFVINDQSLVDAEIDAAKKKAAAIAAAQQKIDDKATVDKTKIDDDAADAQKKIDEKAAEDKKKVDEKAAEDKMKVDDEAKKKQDDAVAALMKINDDRNKVDVDAADAKKKIDDACTAAKQKLDDDAAIQKKLIEDAAAKKKIDDDAAAKKQATEDAAAKTKIDDKATVDKTKIDDAAADAQKKIDEKAAEDKKKVNDEAAAAKQEIK